VIGTIVKLILGVVVIGAVVVGVAAVVPSPSTCTVDAPWGTAGTAQAKWDAWAGGSGGSGGSSVTFAEGDATAILRAHLGTTTPLVDLVVHFCADGTAQVSFGFKAGPMTLHGAADGTISATSPLSVAVTSVRVGALPSAVSDPIVNAVKGVATDAGSLGLAGPVKTVTVTKGQVVVAK
jgi:pectate lyase